MSLFLSFAAAFFTSLVLMRPNLPFLLSTSNTILKPGGLLRWKVQLVKDARPLLPLTEVMKITRATFLRLNVPRESLPRPRLRHGRRLALLFYLNQTLNLFTLFFALSLALLPCLPPPLNSKLFFSQEISFGLRRLPEISLIHFSAKVPA